MIFVLGLIMLIGGDALWVHLVGLVLVLWTAWDFMD